MGCVWSRGREGWGVCEVGVEKGGVYVEQGWMRVCVCRVLVEESSGGYVK